MDKIGKYEVLGKLGEGAMGVVYKALDPLMERVVAIKTMSGDLDNEPELKTRFLREARSAGKLSHKNIITIYELFEEDGRVYIAMEYLDGEEIKAKIARRDQIPLEHKLRFMTEICEGSTTPTRWKSFIETSSQETSTSPTPATSRYSTSAWPVSPPPTSLGPAR